MRQLSINTNSGWINRDVMLKWLEDVFDPFTCDIASGAGIDASPSSMVLTHTFPQHASSFVRHFVSLLRSLPLPVSDPICNATVRTIFLFEASPLFGSGISDSDWCISELGPATYRHSSKRSKKNPVVSDGDGTPLAEDN